jgi:hypothetical protein
MGSMRRGDRVTEMFAFLTVDPDDDCEGIPTATLTDPMTGDPIMMPLIAADKDRVDSLRGLARIVKLKKAGIKMRLVRFTMIETLETFE